MYGDYEAELKKKISFSDIYQLFIEVIPGQHVRSPFRDRQGKGGDSTPSLMIQAYKGELYWKDFGAVGEAEGDGLDFAAKMLGKSRSEAARDILKIDNIPQTYVPYRRNVTKEVTTHHLKPYELAYWETLGVTQQALNTEFVKGLTEFKVGKYPIWESTKNSPKFMYYVDDESWQMYAPKEPKGRRHRSHKTRDKIFGYHSLPATHKGLIITKSYKDILVLKTLGAKSVVSPGSETTFSGLTIRQEELMERFGKIYVGFDDDEKGREAELELCKATGWMPLQLKFGKYKDPAGVIESLGVKGYPTLKKILKDGLETVQKFN